MAEVTSMRNNALPYPVYGVAFAVTFPLLDADGDPISPSSPDSEVSKNGDTFADCTNEATEIATSSGICYLLLTAAEMTADIVTVRIQSTGAKTTVLTLYPRKLPILAMGTCQGANDTGDIQLASGEPAIDDYYNGCLCVAVIDGITEARLINDYVGSTKVGEVSPAWNTAAPDNTDTYTIYLPEGRQVQQANATHWNALPTVALPLIPTVAGRTLDVSAGGEAGLDWANVGSPTTTLNLSGTTVGTAAAVTTVNGLAANVVTATSIASDAITAAKIATGAITAAKFASGAIDAAALASDAVTEIQTAITGGAYDLDTDANGRIRIVDGTGTGELDTSSGAVLVYDFTTAAKAILQAEAEDALVAHRLDELLNADSDIDGAAPPTVGSVFHELLSKTAGSFTFDQTTDSLEALRDRGDAAWITATGFSTLDAAGIRTAVGLASANLDTQLDALPTANEVRNAVTGGAYALSTDSNGMVRIVDGTGTGELDTLSGTVLLRSATEAQIDAIEADTNELQTDWTNGGRLDLLLDAILDDTGSSGVVVASGSKTGYALTSGERDSIAAAHLDLTSGIESGVTPRQAMRGIAAILAGIISGAGTGTEVFKGIGQASGGTTRVTVTVDGSGNRSAMTLNL